MRSDERGNNPRGQGSPDRPRPKRLAQRRRVGSQQPVGVADGQRAEGAPREREGRPPVEQVAQQRGDQGRAGGIPRSEQDAGDGVDRVLERRHLGRTDGNADQSEERRQPGKHRGECEPLEVLAAVTIRLSDHTGHPSMRCAISQNMYS